MALVYARVKALVRLIPPGRAVTYGQVAAWLGEPRAARMVGWALHALTPEEAEGDVPWHRVIGKAGPQHGHITTSCQTHSAQLQRELLEAEGVRFDALDRVDFARFGWRGPTWPEIERILQITRRT